MTTFMINRACCEKGTGDDNQPKDCLDKWKWQSEQVSNDYKILLAKTMNSRNTYSSSLTWETKLKRWQDLVVTIDGKAGDVVDTLQFFVDQIVILCDNSGSTVDALEKITCLVKRIFDAFYTYDEDHLGLKDIIIAFKKEVECSNAGDEEKAEVIKCIEAYEAKIQIVCELQNAILGKLLETLKYTIQLDHFFCNEKSGLKIKIERIIDDFELGLDEEHLCGAGGHHGDENDDDLKLPCDPKEVKPKPKFRIGKDNTYYNEMKKAYETATDKTKDEKKKWIVNKKKSDEKLSQKTRLSEAIRAAETAESGK